VEEVKQVNVDSEFAAEAEDGPEEIPNYGSDGKDDLNDPLGKVLYVDNIELPLVFDLTTFAFLLSDNLKKCLEWCHSHL